MHAAGNFGHTADDLGFNVPPFLASVSIIREIDILSCRHTFHRYYKKIPDDFGLAYMLLDFIYITD